MPWAAVPPYDSKVRFTCSRCGKRYASTDEPVPGRIYAIGCKCGHTIVVKGPEMSGGVRNGASVVREDPFAAFHGKYQVPPAQIAAVARAEGAAGSSPGAAGTPGHPAGAPEPVRARSAAPAPGREPAPYDAVAASHGLLLDVDQARALSSGSISTESVSLPPAQDNEEVSITFSERLDLSNGQARRPWLLVAATTLAILVVFGGAVAVLSRRPGTVRSTEEAAAPAPAAPPAAPAPRGRPLPRLRAPRPHRRPRAPHPPRRSCPPPLSRPAPHPHSRGRRPGARARPPCRPPALPPRTGPVPSPGRLARRGGRQPDSRS